MLKRNWVKALQAQGLRWRINGNAVKQEMQRQGWGGLSYGTVGLVSPSLNPESPFRPNFAHW